MLVALCPAGFEEVDRGSALELAAYLDSRGEERLRSRLGRVEIEEVAPGWADAWRAFHHPIRVGPLWVGPPWEPPDEGATAIVIDPGQAFGTGAHATTRLCLELLLTQPRAALADLGCGSGVLGIAAAKLGHDPIVAVDREPAAVAATRVNAAANGVEIEVRSADVATDPLPEAALVLANLERQLVERVAERIRAPQLVVSGFLGSDHVAFPGWHSVERRELDGWAAELLERR